MVAIRSTYTALPHRIVGQPVRLLEASLFSAVMGRDLATENDLLPDLALDKLSPAALIARCEEWASG